MDAEKCWFYVVKVLKNWPKSAIFSNQNNLNELLTLDMHLFISECLFSDNKSLNLKRLINNKKLGYSTKLDHCALIGQKVNVLHKSYTCEKKWRENSSLCKGIHTKFWESDEHHRSCVDFQELSHLTHELSQAEKKMNVVRYKLSKSTKWHLFHS